MTRTMHWCVAFALLAGCAAAPQKQAALERIDTIVVIYAENHSFDNMYGMFPGADGIANASAVAKTQLDHDGKPLPPRCLRAAQPRRPTTLPRARARSSTSS